MASTRQTEIVRELAFGVLPPILYKIDMSPETSAKIDALKDLLIRRPDLSIGVYTNHLSYPDPVFGGHIIQRIDPERLGMIQLLLSLAKINSGVKHNWELIAPVSYSHTDPEDPKSQDYVRLVKIAQMAGVDTPRIIQAYQVPTVYSEEQAKKTYKDWIKKQLAIKRSGKSVRTFICPEGTRSKDGKMGDVEGGGLRIWGEILSPIVYVPVGIDYLEPYNRGDDKEKSISKKPGFLRTVDKVRSVSDNLNFGKRVRLTIGNIIIQENKNDAPDVNILINNLIEALPPERRKI